jgi:hypothetical protein
MYKNGHKDESVGAGGSRNDDSCTQFNKAPKPIIYKYVHGVFPIYYTEDTWESCRGGPHWFSKLMHADNVEDCSIPHNATIINVNNIIAGLR